MAENRALPKDRKSRQADVGPAEAHVSGVLHTEGIAAGDMLLLDNQLCFAAYALAREIT
jgi:hypothetical protein